MHSDKEAFITLLRVWFREEVIDAIGVQLVLLMQRRVPTQIVFPMIM